VAKKENGNKLIQSETRQKKGREYVDCSTPSFPFPVKKTIATMDLHSSQQEWILSGKFIIEISIAEMAAWLRR
jgi:hypothetical protein